MDRAEVPESGKNIKPVLTMVTAGQARNVGWLDKEQIGREVAYMNPATGRLENANVLEIKILEDE